MCDFFFFDRSSQCGRRPLTRTAAPSMRGTIQQQSNQKSMGSMNNPVHMVRTLQRSGVRDRLQQGGKMHDLFPSLTVLLACVAGADGKYVGRCQQAAFKVTLAA